MKETAIRFGSRRELIGILTEPASPAGPDGRPGVLLLNAGLLHRVGPNRFYVTLARRLAGAGFTAVRFDFSGVGDSPAREDPLPFEQAAAAEVRQAMDALAALRGLERFLLIGVCSGADAAFQAARLDPRVAGFAGINGGYAPSPAAGRPAADPEVRTRLRYSRRRLFNPRSWLRAFTGKSNLAAFFRVVGLRASGLLAGRRARLPGPGASQALAELVARGVDVCLVYSEGSTALDVFHLNHAGNLAAAVGSGRLEVSIIKDVDHVFTLVWAQDHLADLLCGWAGRARQRPPEPPCPAETDGAGRSPVRAAGRENGWP